MTAADNLLLPAQPAQAADTQDARQSLGPSPALGVRLRYAYFASPIYRLALGGVVRDRFAVAASDPYPGEPAAADAMFQGRYRFCGVEVRAVNAPPWLPPGASEGWLEEMHAFEWLRHFRAQGGKTAQRQAQALASDWLRQFGSWRRLVWRPDVLGRRLAAWTQNAGFLSSDADPLFRQAFFESLGRQTRHLTRFAALDVGGAHRLSAVRGLCYVAMCLPLSARHQQRAERQLIQELEAQFLGDGGHIERSPRLMRRLLADLADLRDIFIAANRAPPDALIGAIDRLAPVVRALRHGDGGLACFNNSGEDDAATVDAALTVAQARGKPLDNAPHCGFQRLAARRTVVLVDCGVPAPYSDNAQAGTLSFEMSAGKQRLIVNCGPHWGRGPDWISALRSTAAHSTATVDNTNSTHFTGAKSRRGRMPTAVTCERREQDGQIWLDLSHDGYHANFGLVHHRRLYLSADGQDFRGEDSLQLTSDRVGEDGWPGHPFAIRFHLHPGVSASLAQNGRAALLRVKGGGWQLRASGAALSIAPSVYFGIDGERRGTEQIVLGGRLRGDGAVVKWALRQMSD